MDLWPVCRALAADAGLYSALIVGPANENTGAAASTWVLLTKEPAAMPFLSSPEKVEKLRIAPTHGVVENRFLWTDSYSNLFSVIRDF